MARNLSLLLVLGLAACGGFVPTAPSEPPVDPDVDVESGADAGPDTLGAGSDHAASSTTEGTSVLGSQTSSMSSRRFHLTGALRAHD